LATEGLAGVRAMDVTIAGVTVRVVVPMIEPSAAVIVEEPVARVEAMPVVAMDATATFEEDQSTRLVMSAFDPSVYVPVAVNGSVSPLATEGLAGVKAMEVTIAGVTVRVVVPKKKPSAAVIVDEPVAKVEAMPVVEMDATATFDEDQTTRLVMFAVDPSVYVPVAINGSVSPLATKGFAGVKAMDVTIAGVTVRVVVPMMEPSAAVMVDEPVARVEAMPVVEMDATATFDEDQPTRLVMLAVDPSVYVPVAINGSVSPLATDGLAGVKVIEVNIPAVTVSVVVPVTAPSAAVIVAVPVASVEARPVVEMDATATFDEVHATESVMLAVDPSV
jgi:hypothetical protein